MLNNRNIKSIKFALDSAVRSFGKSIFSNSKIQSLSIPASVEELERGWCKDTSYLTNISISPSNKHFIYLNQEVIIGTKDDEFNVLHFARRDIKTVIIPSFIKYISSYAFSECNLLTNIKFTENSKLLSISKKAFYVTSLQSLSIPDNVEELEDGWCHNTSNLTSISISPKNKHFKFLNDDQKIIIERSKHSEDDFDTLSFACRDIICAYIPSTIKHISSAAFSECRRLMSIEFDENSELLSIGKNAFFRTIIERISVPRNVYSIRRCAFMNCGRLSILEFEENSKLRSIGDTSFSGSIISKITIPRHVKSIESFTFSDCIKLNAIEFDENSELESIEKYAFSFSGIKNLMIPRHVKKIGEFAFYRCENLKTVGFMPGSEIELIENGAFSFLLIKSIKIPRSIQKVDDYAFFKCRYLRSVEFEEESELRSIGEFAFSGVSIESFTIPPKVKELQENWCCHTPILTNIEISNKNDYFSFLDRDHKIVVGKSCHSDVIFENVVVASRDISEAVIPPFIKRICAGAFASESLKKINFLNGSELISIGECGFYDSSIDRISIPFKVDEIGNEAFALCTELRSIEFLCDDEVTFGIFCFNLCDSLFVLAFPNAKKIACPKSGFCEDIESLHLFTRAYAEISQYLPPKTI